MVGSSLGRLDLFGQRPDWRQPSPTGANAPSLFSDPAHDPAWTGSPLVLTDRQRGLVTQSTEGPLARPSFNMRWSLTVGRSVEKPLLANFRIGMGCDRLSTKQPAVDAIDDRLLSCGPRRGRVVN